MTDREEMIPIDPALLTPQNGFEDGEWVLFSWKTGHVDVDQWISAAYAEMADKLMSIRPLTGKMAIWNFAPEWANYVWVGGAEIQWLEEKTVLSVSADHWGDSLYERPFWSKETK